MRRVRLATGLTLACHDGGDPSGTPVLLLHAYADSHRFWEPVLPHLPRGLRVLALTQRGHGLSDKPEGGYDLPTLAADVVGFLDAVEVPRAVLVGHSSGGLVAQQVAVEHPGRVAGLVLVGAPPELLGRRAPFADVVATMDDPVSVDEVRAVLGSLDATRLAVGSDWLEEMLRESARVPARVWRAALAALVDAPAPVSSGAPDIPTAVVWGAEDGVLPRSGQRQLARSWRADLVVVPDAGHLLAWERPDVVAAEIGRLVDARSAEGPRSGDH